MSALAALQRAFAAVLLDGADRAPLEAAVRGDALAGAAERVAIYADMYRLRLVEVLGEVYPRTRALVGEARFDALAAAYVRAHPSRSPSLRGFGDGYAEFLRGQDAPPCAPSLAQLEWTRYEVFDARDQAVLTRAELAALGPEAIAARPLVLLAASRLIACDHDVDALYRALADGGEAVDAPATPTRLLVWRDGHTIYHRVVPTREATLLARLGEGLPLGLLCEALATDQPPEAAAQEAFALVGRWLADGVLAAG